MTLEIQRRLLWLVGPCLAIALVTLAVLGHRGPGFYFFSWIGGAVLVVGVPMAQFAFFRSREYRSRPIAATRNAIIVILGVLTLLFIFGPFNFW